MFKILKTKKYYKSAKDNGIFGSQALFDIVNSSEFEKLFDQTRRTAETFGTIDPILTKLINEKGFDALPILVDRNHYDLLIRSNLREIYRGVRMEGAVNDFAFNPNMFVGKGIYCNGVYFTYGGPGAKAEADLYLYPQTGPHLEKYHGYIKNYPVGDVICALMSKNTKVASQDDLCKLKRKMEKQINKTDFSDKVKGRVIDLISRDLSVVAVLNGYDAVDIKSSKYMVVYNRGKLILKNPNENEIDSKQK
ncbi:MAG: hypothetical protein IKB42_00575 [Clostridia bacterium]|nr:hypothetical protein [Clostridia bacterium]